jgi:hypothetical protein
MLFFPSLSDWTVETDRRHTMDGSTRFECDTSSYLFTVKWKWEKKNAWFEGILATTTVFWDVTSCSLVDVWHKFRKNTLRPPSAAGDLAQSANFKQHGVTSQKLEKRYIGFIRLTVNVRRKVKSGYIGFIGQCNIRLWLNFADHSYTHINVLSHDLHQSSGNGFQRRTFLFL